jgi:hypothetical protein
MFVPVRYKKPEWGSLDILGGCEPPDPDSNSGSGATLPILQNAIFFDTSLHFMHWPGFKFDPIAPLLASTDPLIRLRAGQEMIGQASDPAVILSQPPVRKILAKQRPDGSWRYPGKRAGPTTDYEFLETYRKLGELVELYALDKEVPAVERAAEFLFSRQTEEGDLRGIYGREHSPNYTAGALEVLIHAGYEDDRRVERGLHWLMAMRQDDGGWVIPLRTSGWNFRRPMPEGPDPVMPDRSRPFSHMVTGVVLRAMAASRRFRSLEETRIGARLLASRLLLADKYPDRGTAEYWTKFSFPFWFTDLVSALDSLSLIGIGPGEERMDTAIEWFRSRQRPDGTWRLYYLKGAGISVDEWVHLALCRAMKRYRIG